MILKKRGYAAISGLLIVTVLSVAAVAAAQAAYDPTDEIAAIQSEIDAHGYSWTAGETSMNRIPPEERINWLGIEIPPGETGILPPEALVVRPPSRDLPAHWDWRENAGVTPVKNQGGCGSCWAFAGTAAFESVIRIVTTHTLDLSEQQVLVCNTQGYSCNGGWMAGAYELFIAPGAVGETCMPYSGNDNLPCTQYECEFLDVLDGYQDLPTDVTSLKEAVYDHPVAVAMTVYNDFNSYTGGCYQHDGYDPINHAVLIVGWDDDMCDGEGAWICKNSWGLGWGMAGYFYIKYGSCNIGYGAQEIFYSGIGPVHITHNRLRDTDDENDPYPVVCEVATTDFPIEPGSVQLHYDVGAGWVDVEMTQNREEGTFSAEIPAQPIGTTIHYWLSAADTGGNTDVDPTGAPDVVHTFRVIRTFFADDAETPQDWTFGVPDDDATNGFWERGVPEGTWGNYNRPGNPDRDHTIDPGQYCLVTGAEAGNFYWDYDVDGGKTTLVTPNVNLGGVSSATLTYYRWYTNNAGQYQGEDYWQVDVSGDGGQTWTNLEYTNMTLAIWEEETFPLQDYITLTDSVLIRFVASDYLGPSNVEAAIDDIEIVSMESGSQGVNGEAPVVRRIQLRPGPNPSAGESTVRFVLPETVSGALRIHGVDGRAVRTLLAGRIQGGDHRVTWDGRDEAGQIVPSGVYLIRLTTPQGNAESRLIRVR
jgi:hypothetical protein